jgi:hypothetical protein
VVHRDVKPGNVLVGEDGRARLTDFGIARLLGDAVHYTAPGKMIGTAAYLAPEQLRGEPVDGAADVYALGLVLIEAISGERAFTGPPLEVAVARLSCPPTLPDGLPPGWLGLLGSMTSADPRVRPTAADVAVQLSSLSSRGDVLPPLSALPEDPTPRTAPTLGVRRGPKAVALGALLLIASLGLLLPHGEGGTVASAPEVPPVAHNLQRALEDLHAAIAELGGVPGVGTQLERVDRTLVEHRYIAAAASLRALTALVKRADGQGLVEQARAQGAVTAARRLLALLPIAPRAPAPSAGPTGSGPDVQQTPAPKKHGSGHGAKKHQNSHGKGHRR